MHQFNIFKKLLSYLKTNNYYTAQKRKHNFKNNQKKKNN